MNRPAIAALLLATIAGVAIPHHADAQQRLRQRMRLTLFLQQLFNQFSSR